jgi:DNA-binding transcriptional regulator YiaG
LKAIPNYPGYYADESGEIFSDRNGTLRILPKRLHHGYYRVNVRDTGHPVRTHVMNVHTLVLNTFVGVRPTNYVCRHLNGNPLDNRLCNICWGTAKENARDAIRHGTAVCLRHGEKAPASKLSNEEVKQIRKYYAEGHSQNELASAFCVSQRHISDIVNWKTRCFDDR